MTIIVKLNSSEQKFLFMPARYQNFEKFWSYFSANIVFLPVYLFVIDQVFIKLKNIFDVAVLR